MVNSTTIRPTQWFYAFIILHITLWTLAPALFRFNLPLDAMEGTTWGRQLEWGYDKNPFVNAWLTELAVQVGGQSLVYLFSQISVILCFWAVWTLAKKMMPPLYALLSVLLLEGIQYYNLHAIDFNDNTLELGLWALTALFFYDALLKNKLSDWLLCALFAGLGMMTKYYTAILLLPMLFLVLKHRHCLKTSSFYVGLMVFIAILIPHVQWLFQHDFITIDYAFNRVNYKSTTPFDHLFYPIQFSWQQFETILPALLLSLPLFIGRKPLFIQPPLRVNAFDKEFLFYVGIFPFLFTVILSALTGFKLRAAWGQPLFSLWGIIFILYLQPHVSVQKFYRFILILFCTAAIVIACYTSALIRASSPSSANYPGKIIAATLTEEWNKRYHSTLTYVAGPRWLSGNIAFYSKDRPFVYIDWNKKLSPWINEKELKHHGAIFVWDLSDTNPETSFNEIKTRFPSTEEIQIMQFAWYRNKNMPPVKIAVAFLPPNQFYLRQALNHLFLNKKE